jgi:transcriptional regulator with XRE-family HTH domain
MKKKFDSEKFKQARENAGLSISELARQLGCHFSDVHRYECGTSYPRPGRLNKLVALLGSSILDEPEIMNPISAIGQFRPSLRPFLALYVTLPYPEQCRVLGFCGAVSAFGRLVDADLAGRLSEELAKLIQLPQEQSG